MYRITKSYIRCNGLNSTTFTYSKGIKQGCVLSCLLFALYLNDLEDVIRRESSKGIDVEDEELSVLLKLFTLLYADDTVIFSNTERGLQQSLNIFEKYCNTWKLKINTEKSEILVFGRDRKKVSFKIGGNNIERVKSFKYLGWLTI